MDKAIVSQAGGLQGCKSNISSPAAVVLGLAIAPVHIKPINLEKYWNRKLIGSTYPKWKTGIVMEQIKLKLGSEFRNCGSYCNERTTTS